MTAEAGLRNSNLVRLGSAMALLVLLCQVAPAALCLQDGFNYPAGALGSNAPWVNPTNLITVVESSLAYTNLADFSPSGGAVSVTQGSSSSASVTYRPLDTTLSGGAAYFSLLLKFTSVNANSYITGLLPPTVGLPVGNASDPCDLYVKSAAGGYNLGIRAKTGTAYYQSALLSLNTVYFVVLKYDFATGRASLYLNPSPGGVEPASPDATSTGLAVPSLDHVYLRVSGPNAGSFVVDSLRAGNNWSEVTPIGLVSPASTLAFFSAPRTGTAGTVLTNITVQIQNAGAFNVPSNNVPITVTLNTGSFSSGDATVSSDVYGRAIFTNLAVALPGEYTLTASASGIGAGLASVTSGPLTVGTTNITERGRALAALLDSLQVERYWDNGKCVNWLTGVPGTNGPNDTVGYASHCSAFAPAVAYLLDVYLLRQPDDVDQDLANRQADWLLTNQLVSGWYSISSPADAQHIANAGGLVVASLKEIGKSGHIAVLRPDTKSDAEIATNGPQECQSGIVNYNSTNVRTGFGQHNDPLDRIFYYGHAVTSSIAPAYPVLSTCTLSPNVACVSAMSVVGRRYRLQCTTNFSSWSDVRIFTNPNTSTNFYCETSLQDPSAGAAPSRFYRLSAQ